MTVSRTRCPQIRRHIHDPPFGPLKDDVISPTGWTADQRILADFMHPETLGDLITVDPVSGEEETLLAGDENMRSVTLSPDRRWVSYQIDGPGLAKVMVRPFPDLESAGPWPVGDGTWPLWASQNELFFLRGDTLMSQPMTESPPFVEVEPEVVVQGPYFGDTLYFRPYDYDPQGDRFLVVKDRSTPPSLVVVQGLDQEIAEQSQ